MEAIEECLNSESYIVTSTFLAEILKLPLEKASRIIQQYYEKNYKKLHAYFLCLIKKSPLSIAYSKISDQDLSNLCKDPETKKNIINLKLYAIKKKTYGELTLDDILAVDNSHNLNPTIVLLNKEMRDLDILSPAKTEKLSAAEPSPKKPSSAMEVETVPKPDIKQVKQPTLKLKSVASEELAKKGSIGEETLVKENGSKKESAESKKRKDISKSLQTNEKATDETPVLKKPKLTKIEPSTDQMAIEEEAEECYFEEPIKEARKASPVKTMNKENDLGKKPKATKQAKPVEEDLTPKEIHKEPIQTEPAKPISSSAAVTTTTVNKSPNQEYEIILVKKTRKVPKQITYTEGKHLLIKTIIEEEEYTEEVKRPISKAKSTLMQENAGQKAQQPPKKTADTGQKTLSSFFGKKN